LATGTIKDRLKTLEQNLVALKDFKNEITIEKIKTQKFDEWALRYGFIESIQIIIDISCHLVGLQNLGNPKSYSECIELLAKYDYVSNEYKGKLVSMTGLRNILIHEYMKLDLDTLYNLLGQLGDIEEFVQAIRKYIENNN